jgi:hypothetical protein
MGGGGGGELSFVDFLWFPQKRKVAGRNVIFRKFEEFDVRGG